MKIHRRIFKHNYFKEIRKGVLKFYVNNSRKFKPFLENYGRIFKEIPIEKSAKCRFIKLDRNLRKKSIA